MTKDDVAPTSGELLDALGAAAYKALSEQKRLDDDTNYQKALDDFVYMEPGTRPERRRVPKATSVEEAVPQQLRKDAAAIVGWFLPQEASIKEELSNIQRGHHDAFVIEKEGEPLRIYYDPGTYNATVYARIYQPDGAIAQELNISRTIRGETDAVNIGYSNHSSDLYANVGLLSASSSERRSARKWGIDDNLWGIQKMWKDKENRPRFEFAMQDAAVMAQQVLKLMKEHPPREFSGRNMRQR